MVVKAGSLAFMVLRAASMEPSSSAPPSCRSCSVCSTGSTSTSVCGWIPPMGATPPTPSLSPSLLAHLLCRPVPDPNPIGGVCIAYPGLHRVELQQLHLRGRKRICISTTLQANPLLLSLKACCADLSRRPSKPTQLQHAALCCLAGANCCSCGEGSKNHQLDHCCISASFSRTEGVV